MAKFKCQTCGEQIRPTAAGGWTHQTRSRPLSLEEAKYAILKDEVCDLQRLRIEITKTVGTLFGLIRTMRSTGVPVDIDYLNSARDLLRCRKNISKKVLERKAALAQFGNAEERA